MSRLSNNKTEPRKPVRAKPPTLADVARLAGVVPMTASRALNNSGYVGAEARKKVLAAARRLNYRPNLLARTLRGQGLRAIGIMLADLVNPFSSELAEGMKRTLRDAGYAVFLASAAGGVDEEKDSLLAFVDHRVDGIVAATRGTQIGSEVLTQIARRGVPVAIVGHPVEGAKVDCVTADHRSGAREAVEHLLSLGHKRIAFLGIAPEDSGRLRRFQGYADALESAGIERRSEYIVGPANGPSYATQEDGHSGLRRLMELPHPPTAVFTRNDFAAIGALRAAHELGLNVPSDLALAGFDNIPLAAYSNPPLTTVEQPIREQGSAAARFLLDRIEGKPGKRRELCFPCKLIVRASTDPRLSTPA